MLPKHIQEMTFGNVSEFICTGTIDRSQKILASFNLSPNNLPISQAPRIELPSLVGGSLRDHFYYLGLEQAEPYLSVCKDMISKTIPAAPLVWSNEPGWTKYTHDSQEHVEYPDGDCLVFDVEVLVKLGHHPIIATAVSSTSWFSWTSPSLFTDAPPSLISFGPPHINRVVIGHNIGYDRARIQEEFTLTPTKTAFVDTMSLHTCISGLSSQQLPTWQARKSSKKKFEAEIDQVESKTELPSEVEETAWENITCRNSLQSVAELHLGKKISKEARSVFVVGAKGDVQDRFQELMTYCSQDVVTTFQVYTVLFPQYLIKCPHPLTFAGMLKLSKCFLPVNDEWGQFKDKANETYNSEMDMIDAQLLEIAEHACKMYTGTDEWKKDMWLRNLDWNIKEEKEVDSTKESKRLSVVVSEKTLARREITRYKNESLRGRPQWYRDLWDPVAKKIVLKLGMRISPFLLQISYKDSPLMHHPTYGWFYAVPKESLKVAQEDETLDDMIPSIIALSAEDGTAVEKETHHSLAPGEIEFSSDEKMKKTYHHIASLETDKCFLKVPHPDGPKSNCGNPLGKSYKKDFETGVFASMYPKALDVLARYRRCGYWTSVRARVESQFVHHDDQVPPNKLILPLMVPFGTITRRVVEGTWMTLSNPKKDKIGTEVKSLVKAPKGYAFIGADVDSEELWIASLLGDAQFGIHGATPLGFMTLEGSKKNGTDLHSRTAQILGVSRDDAKIFNYARIYGAGVAYAAKILKQCSGETDDAKADLIAKKLYAETKGIKLRIKKKRKNKGEVADAEDASKKMFWCGGSESFMFNSLESIVDQDAPRTPALGCIIPNGLTKLAVKKKVSDRGYTSSNSNQFMTSRINWVVQSSGVDYLHLLLVSMDYLCRRLKIDVQLIITIHDEVRYLAKEEDQYMAAYALQIANLWTRTFFSHQVGINSLPLSVAFFSSVDIDHCLRKEVTLTCITPSNPIAVPPGISQDIYQTIASINITPEMFGDELQSIVDIKSKNRHPPELYSHDQQSLGADNGYIDLQTKLAI